MARPAYDILVYGATGFTGQRIVRQVLRQRAPVAGPLRWAVAGRDARKLEALVAEIEAEGLNGTPRPDVKIADVSEYARLAAVVAEAAVVINCVGPFKLYGEPVVRACAEAGVSYVDVNGEPDFIEATFLNRDAAAKKSKATLVLSCGFDSLPADIGVLFGKQKFAESGGAAASIEMFVELSGGKDGVTLNYATLESAVLGIANADKLRALRKQIKRPALQTIGPKLAVNKVPHWERRLDGWVLPFIGADASVVRMGQQLTDNRRVPPVNFAAYVLQKRTLYFVFFVVWGALLEFCVRFAFLRCVILRYPEICSFGLFKRGGPSEQQLKDSKFCQTFIAHGYASKDAVAGVPDTEIRYTVSGPEFGYVATPMCAVTSAYMLLDEKQRFRIPSGVHTPASAFCDTNIIQVLQEQTDVRFRVLSIRN